MGRRNSKGDGAPAGSGGASREDRAAEGTLADPEQDRPAPRAAWGDRRGARSILPSGADLEKARGKDRRRDAEEGFPRSASGALRARARLGKVRSFLNVEEHPSVPPSHPVAEPSIGVSVELLPSAIGEAYQRRPPPLVLLPRFV